MRPGRAPTRRFVVGYDGSPASASALRWAAMQAGGQGGRVLVVHAREAGGTRPAVTAAAARARAGLEALFLEGGPLVGAAVELRVAEEAPAAALCRAATEIDADGIVVGRHQGGALGSDTVREILARTDRPVTVVP